VLESILMVLRLLKRQCHIWLPGYLSRHYHHNGYKITEGKHLDVIFLLVDHFEPARKEGALGVAKVRKWCEKYEIVAKQHTDSDGRMPQHTWFYRYDYPNFECINILSEYSFKGLGEIEFHLHHGYDSPASFAEKIQSGVKWFTKAGAMISAEKEPQMRFAYIAGNWALDNGRRNAAFSGVNNELGILGRSGCYADFTFPAIGTNAQPRKVNAIYYAKDTPKPKSYNRGTDVEVMKNPCGDLMIFQGPVYVDWKRKYTETAELESFSPYQPVRINYWMNAGIHVTGRPEWIFIKLHTHGMQSSPVILDGQFDRLLSDLERYFKRPPFRLHYVTAREAYNIVKAAEAGKTGNPNKFRNFLIGEPLNRKIFCSQPYRLEEYSENHVVIDIEPVLNKTTLNFKGRDLEGINGQEFGNVEIVHDSKVMKRLRINADGAYKLL
jgi:hypothetical protein